MRRIVPILALSLGFACREPAPPAAQSPDTPPAAEPSPTAPEVGHFAGRLNLPTGGGFDWLIRYDLAGSAAGLWIPKQNVEGLAATEVGLAEDGAVVMKWKTLMITWSITADGESCSFRQGPAVVECEVEAIAAETFAERTARDRPQDPEPPFPYAIEQLNIPNPEAEGVTLAATLTVPEGEGPHPAVVLVSGSGPQDRDETIFGHKPFWLLADHLSRRGVAVLRYDDRGWAESTGDPNGTTEDFASDTLAVLRHVAARPDIDAGRLGIVGHSEGAMIATMLAARQPKQVAFIVMLAGPGVVGHELLARQTELGMRLSETDEDAIAIDAKLLAEIYARIASEPVDQAKADIRKLWAEAKGDEPGVDKLLRLADNPWMRFFLAYDPRPDLAKIRVPVLALIGTTDIQVDDEQNLPAIEAALKKARNKRATVLARPGLNHLFQHSETGSPEDYETITETFDPETLELVGKWIVEQAGVEP